MKIDVKLINTGFLLPGAGEGSALIDADPVVTKEGFPYFPARTFKGLLKEALREVLEIQGKHAEADRICAELFGLPDGPEAALLRFKNLYLNDFAQAQSLLPAYKAKFPNALDPGRVTAHYTWEVAQTAIAADGVAKDRSLRNFRAIRPAQTFIGTIEFKGQDPSNYINFLHQAASQLRYAGTKRNRGFGKIKVELNVREVDKSQPDKDRKDHLSWEPEALRITVNTTSSTVLSAITGDRNTVSSDPYVRGSRIRGLIAEHLIQSLDLGMNAHTDELFQEAILSGKVHFRPAYQVDALPVPLNVHKIKGRAEEDLLDAFRKDLLTDDRGLPRNIRTVGGLAKIENGQLHKKNTSVSARFHNSRPNRSAGRSMENDEEGGIFYYEGIEAGQSFSGVITGDSALLQKLYNELPQKWGMRMGKSKTAQYGSVLIDVEPIQKRETSVDLSKAKQVLLHFRSPVKLLNQNGFPVCNETVLREYLTRFGIRATVINSAAKVTLTESWNRQWSSRSGRFPVYQEGSVFLLQVNEADQSAWQKLLRDGLGELPEQGFGWVEAQPWDDFPHRIAIPKPSEPTDFGEPKGSKVLDMLVDSFAITRKENEIRLHGLESVKDHELIPNSLLSRLDQKLSVLVARQGNTMTMVKSFRNWLEELKERPAGDTLKKRKLYEPLHDFFERLPAGFQADETTQRAFDPKIEQEAILLAVICWKAIFKTIRHRNKKTNGQ